MPKIMMPITALNDHCITCPELNITVDRSVYYDGIEETMAEVDIYCSHWKRCMSIYNSAKKDWEENHVTKLSRDIPSDPLARE